MMIVTRLRMILGAELVAYYFAAPYIILLGLDEKRGLFDIETSMQLRLFAYALLVGIYPFLLMFVSPYIGRQLDMRHSKISVLRKIHLANCICYSLLAIATWQHSLMLAIIALAIPGMIGCASPVGKSLIATLTKTEVRTEEFGKLAFIKGMVKLFIPLLGAFIFKFFFDNQNFAPLFFIPAALSLSCFATSFTFPHSILDSAIGDAETTQPFEPAPLRTAGAFTTWECSPAVRSDSDSKFCIASASRTAESRIIVPQESAPKKPTPTIALFLSLVKKRSSLMLLFVLMLIGYSLFVKFTPFLLFDKLGDNPSIVNYFASLVGLAATLNQFVVVRYAATVKKRFMLIFLTLLSLTTLLCISNTSPLWFLGFFGILFCFSVLNTSIEAELSLQGVATNQGAVQGILYSMENWSYIVAPIVGSTIASVSTVYPLYFVTLLSLAGTLLFAYFERSKNECYTKAG